MSGDHDELLRRLAALEERVGRLEDERAIADVVASYGLLVDHGAADEVAALWTADGAYRVDALEMAGTEAIAAMVSGPAHQGLIARGCAHFQGPVAVTVDGDAAVAVGYSLLVLHREGRFAVARATANHWSLARSGGRWRVVERTSRLLDGNPEAHGLTAEGLTAGGLSSR